MKKIALILLLPLFALMLLYAHGAAEKAVESRPPVVDLKLWYSISGTNGKFFESQVNAYLAEHPEVTVELTYSGSYADSATKISAAKLSGDAPDLIVTSASQLYTGEDEDFSMESRVKDEDFAFDDLQAGILEYAKYNGRLAALPFGISTQVFYYNKALVSKAGLDLSGNPPKTWDQFLDVAKKVQAANPGIWGFDTSDGVWLIKSMLYQNGNKVVEVKDGRVTPVFADASGIEVAEFWKRMVDESVMPAGQHDNAEKKFLSGSLAFIAATSNRISRWPGSTDFEIGAIEMPCFRTQSVALGGSTCTILTTDYWKADAAWQLLKHILNNKNQTDFALTSGYLPIRKSSLENAEVKAAISASELYAVATKQLGYAWAYTHFAEMGSMDAMFWYALDEIEHYTKTPEKAFKDASASLLAEME